MAKQNTIQVNSDTFRKFLFARARSNAATKRANDLRASLGLPEANKSTVGEYVLIDGNKQPVGKYTVSPKAGFTVKDTFTGKVS
jgi:hypothetical protein